MNKQEYRKKKLISHLLVETESNRKEISSLKDRVNEAYLSRRNYWLKNPSAPKHKFPKIECILAKYEEAREDYKKNLLKLRLINNKPETKKMEIENSNLSCPQCYSAWGIEEIDFQQCDSCGYPDDDDYDGKV